MDWKIGTNVFVNADNYGSPAVVIDEREPGGNGPRSRYKVRTSDGQEFWALDFEISKIETESERQTREHIRKVQDRIEEFRSHLYSRGKFHDASKLEEPERSGYEALHTRLADVEYGTDEYRAALAEAKSVTRRTHTIPSISPTG